MQNILVIGAGKSTSYLIDYLLQHAGKENWHITVADMDVNAAAARIHGHHNAEAVAFNVKNDTEREKYILNADLVISMLPASMHGEVARDCVRLKKHLATASYVSAEMKALHDDARQNGIILMNEIGLDPGIDHASAMKIIDEIHANGGQVDVFKSYCGGLVAPESNDNPWGYKFSWNPRNVILAGQGTAQYLKNEELKFIPYNRIFTQTETVKVEGYGSFDGYANRDSISYREPYGLHQIRTLLRGTLRMPGYCRAWNVFVKLGLADDTWQLPAWNDISWPKLLQAFLPETKNVKDTLIDFAEIRNDTETIQKLEWLGIFDDENIVRVSGLSPAQVLQSLLEKKWALKQHDKDMIVMQHIFEYLHKGSGNRNYITSSLVVIGKDQTHTAMAKTVGLPLGIVSRMILQGKISQKGVTIPVSGEIYNPLLAELEQHGVKFVEQGSGPECFIG